MNPMSVACITEVIGAWRRMCYIEGMHFANISLLLGVAKTGR